MGYVTDKAVNRKRGQRCKTDKEYLEIENIRTKWRVVNKVQGSLCGNVSAVFKKNKAELTSDNFFELQDFTQSWDQISSALALYRAISLFQCGLNSKRVDFYKLNWEVIIEHKETKTVFALGEWKGGFQIFTPAHNVKELPEKYILDAEQLLSMLINPNMPIGYDGTIAGTVA